MSATPQLRLVRAVDVEAARFDPLDAETLSGARSIVEDVRQRGEDALREHATRLGDLDTNARLMLDHGALRQALGALDADTRALLERTADRIRNFAAAQRAALRDMETRVPGGRAGHRVHPHSVAGCYAPGGRFALPSSMLMTVVTARVAGVATVWAASPRPSAVVQAAAAIAGADALLCVGGAQAIGAFAFGAGPVPRCDVIVGPGNRWVTAAKQCVSGRVAIDMLAGPSELVVLADDTADAQMIAADLLAQAEHDADAAPILVTTHAPLVEAVNAALGEQLAKLPTRATAAAAVANGFAVVAASLSEAIAVCDRIAPEHLQVLTHDAPSIAERLSCYGGVFVGAASAEVLGDYGVGPNHTLPTGGSARFVGGLSVLTFLRVNTWLEMSPADGDYANVCRDAARLARLEGLEAHARTAERRAR